MANRRVILLSDGDRPETAEVADSVRAAITAHADLVAELSADDVAPLPASIEADLAVVVGGDGTLIRQAGRIADRSLPLVGVNVGRLGFLAEFDVDSLAEHGSVIFSADPPMHEHMLLAVVARDASGRITAEGIAVNDCVIAAGEPFRMIELNWSIDGAAGPTLTGDGLIVATPIGSTAYNVSAGGPIIHPELDAFVITPLAAHSLAFRPTVLRADSVLRLEVARANEGTRLLQDGTATATLRAGDTVEVRMHARKALFIDNPSTTYWRILQDKLRWAVPPTYRHGPAK